MGAPDRGEWSSQIGFILAAAGSAIGLGNIWRFPYIAGEQGGGAFVLVYLACVLLLGLPVMLAEISLGRATQRNPVGALEQIRPGTRWKLLGYLALLTGLGILSYYAVIAGKVVAYLVGYASGGGAEAAGVLFGGPWKVCVFLLVFIVLTVLVVVGGVKHGIERWAKILMPVLLLMMFALIVRGLFLPGASEGLAWFLTPDFSKISFEVVLSAMSQAFFSLSLGMGAMLTYGSYLSRHQNLLRCGAWVVVFDTGIAILAGLMIFPAVFALGHDPTSGPTLIFEVLPSVFLGLPGGVVVGFAFFFLLSVAALTSTVSLLEVVTAYFVDERSWSRTTTVIAVGAAAFLLGVPSALNEAGVEPWTTVTAFGTTGFLGIMDFLWGNLSLAVGSLLLCLFVIFVWKVERCADEIESTAPEFRRLRTPFILAVRFLCPIAIAVILASIVLH